MTERDGQRRLGQVMIYLAWIGFLLALMVGFQQLLDHWKNPNRRVQGQVATDGSRQVVLQRNRGGHYVATAVINDQAVEVLLDTGASTVSVPMALADSLGLKAGYPQRVSTANGMITVYATRIERLSLGPIIVQNVAAHLNPYADDDIVLLGMSFMADLELIQRGDTLTLRQY